LSPPRNRAAGGGAGGGYAAIQSVQPGGQIIRVSVRALDGIGPGGDTTRTHATHDPAAELVALARFLPRWAGVRIV
jgi:hypothetical protein